MIATKPRIGDLCEIKTPAGLSFVQYTHDNRSMGQLVRVVPGLFRVRPSDFGGLAKQRELYFVFYTLNYAVHHQLAKVVSHQPVPKWAQRNRAFLHARFGLSDDPLQPYKRTIDRWVWPDVFQGQQPSVSRAKQAITQYREALGDPVGLAELLVFYCERATGFCRDVGHRDTAYLNALVRTFEQALKATVNLTGKIQNGFLTRLESVRSIGLRLGNAVGEEMDVLISEFDLSVHARGSHRNRKISPC